MNESNTQPTSLLSLIVHRTPHREAALDVYPGRLLHGAFLNFLRKHDPELSQILHDASTEKPYTLSTLYGPVEHRDGNLLIHGGVG